MLIALWFPVCEICFDYTNFALELNTLKFELWEHIEPNKKALWLISWYIMNISLRLALPTLPICNANICLCSMSSSPLSAVDWLCSIGLAIRKSLELVYRLVKSFAVWNNVEKWNGMGKVDTIHPRQWSLRLCYRLSFMEFHLVSRWNILLLCQSSMSSKPC